MSNAAGWIASADSDLDAVRRCLAEPPNLSAAAYHPQQAVEKLIKAVLVALGIAYPRGRSGHDLRRRPTMSESGWASTGDNANGVDSGADSRRIELAG